MSQCIQCGKEIGNASGHICKPEAPTDPQLDHFAGMIAGTAPEYAEPPPAQAPREWKLLISDMEITVYDQSEFDSCPDPNSDDPDLESSAEELVHVIEYAAYERLERELAGACATIKYEQRRANAWQERAEVAEAAADKSNYRNTVRDLNAVGKERDQARAELANRQVKLDHQTATVIRQTAMLNEVPQLKDELTQARVELAGHKYNVAVLDKANTELKRELAETRQGLSLAEADVKFWKETANAECETNLKNRAKAQALVEACERLDKEHPLCTNPQIQQIREVLKQFGSGASVVDKAIDREDVARSREEPHPGDEQLDLLEWGERNERSNS